MRYYFDIVGIAGMIVIMVLGFDWIWRSFKLPKDSDNIFSYRLLGGIMIASSVVYLGAKWIN